MVQYLDSVESDDTDSDDDLPTLDEIVDMINQEGMSERSKHIDVKFNFVKRLVRDNTATCPHVATYGMIADIFTKDLPDESYGRHSVSVLGAQVYGTVSTFSCPLLRPSQ